MFPLKCCVALTACLLALCLAHPIPQTPAAAVGLSSDERAESLSAEDAASLSMRNGVDDLESTSLTTDEALTKRDTTTTTKSYNTTPTKTSVTVTPFATVTLNPCGPTIEEEESCSSPPFKFRRDDASSALGRAVARLSKIRATVDDAFESVADYGSIVQLTKQAYHELHGSAGSWLGQGAAMRPEASKGCRFWECPKGWNAVAGISSDVCRCAVGSDAGGEMDEML